MLFRCRPLHNPRQPLFTLAPVTLITSCPERARVSGSSEIDVGQVLECGPAYVLRIICGYCNNGPSDSSSRMKGETSPQDGYNKQTSEEGYESAADDSEPSGCLSH